MTSIKSKFVLWATKYQIYIKQFVIMNTCAIFAYSVGFKC